MKKYLIALGIAAFSLIALAACSDTPSAQSQSANVVGVNSIGNELDCEKTGQRGADGRPMPQC